LKGKKSTEERWKSAGAPFPGETGSQVGGEEQSQEISRVINDSFGIPEGKKKEEVSQRMGGEGVNGIWGRKKVTRPKQKRREIVYRREEKRMLGGLSVQVQNRGSGRPNEVTIFFSKKNMPHAWGERDNNNKE